MKKRIKVTVVELADHAIGPLDPDMAAFVHQYLSQRDSAIFEEWRKQFNPGSDQCKAVGWTYIADMVIRQ